MLFRFLLILAFSYCSLPVFTAERYVGKKDYTFPVQTVEYLDVQTSKLRGQIEIYLPNEIVIRRKLPINERIRLDPHIHPISFYANYAAGYPVFTPIYGSPTGFKNVMKMENGKVGVRVILDNSQVLISESYLFVPLGFQPMLNIPIAEKARRIMSIQIFPTLITFGTEGAYEASGLYIKTMNNTEDSDRLAAIESRRFYKATGNPFTQPRL